MMAENENNEQVSQTPLDEEVLRLRLAEIEGTLMAGIEADTRLQSSIPEEQRNDALDFIQMTGLTRPPLANMLSDADLNPEEAGELSPDIDINRPLSFYQSGITDVDDSLTPPGVESAHAAPMPAEHRSRSADALKQIIAELSLPASRMPDPEEFHDDAIPSLIDMDDQNDEPATETPSTPMESDIDEQASMPETLAAAELPEAVVPENLAEPETIAPPEIAPADDFDSLLQASAIDLQVISSLQIPEPDKDAANDWIAPAPGVTQRLAEAEQLLQELEQQPRDETASTESIATVSPGPAAVADNIAPVTVVPREIRWSKPAESAPQELSGDESERDRQIRLEYDYSAAPGRHSHRRAHHRRRFVRMAILLLLLLVVAGAGGIAYWILLKPAIALPEELIAEAQNYSAHDDYAGAARAYKYFLSKYPDHIGRAEAQYEAAFALKLAPGASRDAVRTLREESLALFKQFVTDNPGNPKRARAECMMGVLYYELGDYKNAISLLREPARQVDDPDAVLPVLRTLAWSYRMDGSYEEAESAYLQAASLPRNYSPDADYYELGDMYRKRAESVANPDERRAFRLKTVEYWDKAVHVSQIDPGTRDTVQRQLDRLRAEMGVDGELLPIPASAPNESEATRPEPPSSDGGAGSDGAKASDIAAGDAANAAPAAGEKPKEWEPDPAVEAPPPPEPQAAPVKAQGEE